MAETRQILGDLIERVEYPVTKEELINGLLTANAPTYEVALADRLPRTEYRRKLEVEQDLEEISRIRESDIAAAETFDDYLDQVLKHVGDVKHTTKASYNAVVDGVLKIAGALGKLDQAEAKRLRMRLEGAFADLRQPMSKVMDDSAPLDPNEDLPRFRK